MQKLHHLKFTYCISKLDFPLLGIDEIINVTFIKANIYLGPTYSFRSLVHFPHSKKHGTNIGKHNAREGMSVLHLDPKKFGRYIFQGAKEGFFSTGRNPKTHPNSDKTMQKATLPNRATPTLK